MPAINKQIERKGAVSSPIVGTYPKVHGGVCEACGVMDNNADSVNQYKLCPHYRGMQLACSYCESTTNPDEVIARSIIQVFDHPDRPNQLVVVCNTSTCLDKHYKRFQVNA